MGLAGWVAGAFLICLQRHRVCNAAGSILLLHYLLSPFGFSISHNPVLPSFPLLLLLLLFYFVLFYIFWGTLCLFCLSSPLLEVAWYLQPLVFFSSFFFAFFSLFSLFLYSSISVFHLHIFCISIRNPRSFLSPGYPSACFYPGSGMLAVSNNTTLESPWLKGPSIFLPLFFFLGLELWPPGRT
ncbi:hypothetical protein SODALDRAFT_117774 [Sodiomyces alkalinus F11]|uniref:Uncharacterized protein n=1 Tax=Sodiomyces alkalinus (strain CBS 110278 / VKM F-3762 / F11) TaxID=1314773 RepID=A0A3N2Q3W5_SODAK|nr:hypothetical protein SODALDRAFT_117774 [Sodiomyces alkalinus F11]ROT41368.1 hypothetical protein SODALDRAFT_117774 [Sodiomyces alkalinus F11]